MPVASPEVTVWLIDSSLVQVSVVPTLISVVAGMNISRDSLMTGPSDLPLDFADEVSSALPDEQAVRPAVSSAVAAKAMTDLRTSAPCLEVSTWTVRCL